MKSNKSIDGLATRGAKKSSAKVSATNNKSINVKTATKKPATTRATVKTSTTKPVVKTTVTKPVAKKAVKNTTTTTKPVAKSIDVKEEPKKTLTHEEAVADFLKPVQAFDFDSETGELKVSEEPIKKEDHSMSNEEKSEMKVKAKKEKKKPSKARRIITTIILLIVLAMIGVVCWAVFWGNDIIAKITGGQGNVFDLIKFVEPTYDPLKTDANGRTNILAFGTSGFDMSGDEGDGVHAGAQLTDSIMAISLNQETGDIAMLSLPRDLKASPTCTRTGKINEVYWCNGGGYDISTDQEREAAQALMDEVGGILGIDFQYFAHLNWGSLVSIVDTLGGITITLDEDIDDDWWTGAVYQAGVAYTLNGEEALGLARARHGTAGGDFTRGASQQKILIGIKDKILEKSLSITDILSLATTLGDNFRSNFSIDEIKSAAHLTFDFDFESMRQISLWPDYMTTGTIDEISYVLPRAGAGNYSAVQEYVAEQTSNDPRVYEHPTIAIYNASGVAGAAATESTKLEEAGYTIAAVDNAPEGLTFTDDYTIYYGGGMPGTEAMVSKQYPGVKFKSMVELPEGIPRTYNFVIILGPTPAPEETTNSTEQPQE